MGTTTLRELYNIGLISREELSTLKQKIDKSRKNNHPKRLRPPSGQHPIPIQQLSHYINIARTGNGCHYPQEQLHFGHDRKEPTHTRPVLIVGYPRRGPTVTVCPLTAKSQTDKTHFFFIEHEQWSLLKTFKQNIKNCTAVPYCETVNICSLELFGYLNPNTTEEIQHWLKQTNTDC